MLGRIVPWICPCYCYYLNGYNYVGRKVRICEAWIRTSRDNPWISCTIHGSRVAKGAKYKFEENHWIELRKQLITWFARRSSPRVNYRSVSGVALAGLYKSRAQFAQSHSNVNRQWSRGISTALSTLLPFVFNYELVWPSLSMAASARPLAFGSGAELVWLSHTLSCGYARLEGSLVCSQVQFEDKLQVSGVALAS